MDAMAGVQEDFTKMVTHLFKSGEEMQKELTVMDLELIHAVMGISGEADEIVSAINDEDDENLLEELGDIEFYLNKLRTLLELPEHNPVDENEIDEALKIQAHSREFLEGFKDGVNILAGRTLDLVKKATIYRKPLKRDEVAEELKDFDICLQVAYRALKIDREEVLRYNINKLGKRYKNGYSNQAAQDRADKN